LSRWVAPLRHLRRRKLHPGFREITENCTLFGSAAVALGRNCTPSRTNTPACSSSPVLLAFRRLATFPRLQVLRMQSGIQGSAGDLDTSYLNHPIGESAEHRTNAAHVSRNYKEQGEGLCVRVMGFWGYGVLSSVPTVVPTLTSETSLVGPVGLNAIVPLSWGFLPGN